MRAQAQIFEPIAFATSAARLTLGEVSIDPVFRLSGAGGPEVIAERFAGAVGSPSFAGQPAPQSNQVIAPEKHGQRTPGVAPLGCKRFETNCGNDSPPFRGSDDSPCSLPLPAVTFFIQLLPFFERDELGLVLIRLFMSVSRSRFGRVAGPGRTEASVVSRN